MISAVMSDRRLSLSSIRSRSSLTIGSVKGRDRRAIEDVGAAKMLHADATGEFPIVRPSVAIEIADDVRMNPDEGVADLGASVLYADEESPRLVESVAELDDVVERGRCEGSFGDGWN